MFVIGYIGKWPAVDSTSENGSFNFPHKLSKVIYLLTFGQQQLILKELSCYHCYVNNKNSSMVKTLQSLWHWKNKIQQEFNQSRIMNISSKILVDRSSYTTNIAAQSCKIQTTIILTSQMNKIFIRIFVAKLNQILC